MNSNLPTNDQIDVCRLITTFRSEHGQFMQFYRSRPGVAEILHRPTARAILLLEPNFSQQEDWVLALKYYNESGQSDDGDFYPELLSGTSPENPESEQIPARSLRPLAETGGTITRVDVCQRLKSYDGSISSAHSSRKDIAELVGLGYPRTLLILNKSFVDSKDWAIVGLSKGFVGCKRDEVGLCLAGTLPHDFQSATALLETINSYRKLCVENGPYVL